MFNGNFYDGATSPPPEPDSYARYQQIRNMRSALMLQQQGLAAAAIAPSISFSGDVNLGAEPPSHHNKTFKDELQDEIDEWLKDIN